VTRLVRRAVTKNGRKLIAEAGDAGLPITDSEARNAEQWLAAGELVNQAVISRHPDHFVADVGRRVVGVEYGPPIPVGIEASSVALSDEHATVTMLGSPPALGSQVDFIPGQIRTTFNLHDRVWVSRAGQIVDCWPVSARGASQ
jgi:D-serine deaminase-like pyridoxal phosphate-dependent protein